MYWQHQLSQVSRRGFLKLGLIGSGIFALGWVPKIASASTANPEALGPFIKIGADSTVTVVIKHLDKGQGVTTGLTAIVAEELDAEWSQMAWEFAPADASRYNNLLFGPMQGTGGSTSIANSWQQLREAGAAARHMLMAAAAEEWAVDVESVTISSGVIKHPSGKQAQFGDLAELAARQPVPAEPQPKNPSSFTLVGKHVPRIDSPQKSTGKAIYTIDVRRPNMLHAAILHAPVFGASLKSLDSKAAEQISGVKKVVVSDKGVAVLAKDTWAALQGRNALQAQWDESSAETRSSEQLWQDFAELAEQPGAVVQTRGDSNAALAEAAKTLELEFRFPYLSHASMEPLNAVAQIKDGECHVWTGSQLQSVDHAVAAEVAGVSAERTFIHTQYAGGSFGRRATPNSDIVAEAVSIAKAAKTAQPISLQWSREDDIKGGYFRPMSLHRMRAGIDAEGNIGAWQHRVVGQSILRGTPFQGMIQGPLDPSLTEGAANLPYQIPHFHCDGHEAAVGVPTLWWRSVGHSFNGYATEVFFDEVARIMGADPLDLRLQLLAEHPRHKGVLELVASKANWGKTLGANRGQGLAVHESFGSVVAQIAEVTVKDDGSYSVDKITCAVDCGIAVTPDVIKAQIEGGIGYGLGAAMGEAITLANGRVVQSNFYDYFPMRIAQMPRVEVHIVASGNPPTGVGEPGTPPAAPAVANALRPMLAKPLTQLPFGQKLTLA